MGFHFLGSSGRRALVSSLLMAKKTWGSWRDNMLHINEEMGLKVQVFLAALHTVLGMSRNCLLHFP